jgi:hypothetical protein
MMPEADAESASGVVPFADTKVRSLTQV